MALLVTQARLVLGNKLHAKQDDCALKADRTPAGRASVMSSRLVAIDPGSIGFLSTTASKWADGDFP